MEVITSFGDAPQLNAAAKANTRIMKLWDKLSPAGKRDLVTDLAEFGCNDDRDAILLGVVVNPALYMLEHDWSEDEVNRASELDRDIITAFHFTKDMYALVQQAVNFNQPEHLIMADISDITRSHYLDTEEYFKKMIKYMECFPVMKQFNSSQKSAFMKRFQMRDELWYTNAVNNFTGDEIKRYLMFGDCAWAEPLVQIPLDRLRPQMVANYYRLDVVNKLPEIRWIHFLVDGVRQSYPVYCSKEIKASAQKLIESKTALGYERYGADLYIMDKQGLKMQQIPFPDYNANSVDPVKLAVDTYTKKLHLKVQNNVADAYMAMVKFANQDKDWYLFLQFPDKFNSLQNLFSYRSIAHAIYAQYQDCMQITDQLCCPLVQIDECIMPIYTAYTSGTLQWAIKEGRTIKVGFKDEKDLKLSDYYNDFVGWVRTGKV